MTYLRRGAVSVHCRGSSCDQMPHRCSEDSPNQPLCPGQNVHLIQVSCCLQGCRNSLTLSEALKTTPLYFCLCHQIILCLYHNAVLVFPHYLTDYRPYESSQFTCHCHACLNKKFPFVCQMPVTFKQPLLRLPCNRLYRLACLLSFSLYVCCLARRNAITP